MSIINLININLIKSDRKLSNPKFGNIEPKRPRPKSLLEALTTLEAGNFISVRSKSDIEWKIIFQKTITKNSKGMPDQIRLTICPKNGKVKDAGHVKSSKPISCGNAGSIFNAFINRIFQTKRRKIKRIC